MKNADKMKFFIVTAVVFLRFTVAAVKGAARRPPRIGPLTGRLVIKTQLRHYESLSGLISQGRRG